MEEESTRDCDRFTQDREGQFYNDRDWKVQGRRSKARANIHTTGLRQEIAAINQGVAVRERPRQLWRIFQVPGQ
jgi:hypothetical protein